MDFDERLRVLENRTALVNEIPELRKKIMELEVKLSIVDRLDKTITDLTSKLATLQLEFMSFKSRIGGAIAVASLAIPFLTAMSLKLMHLAG